MVKGNYLFYLCLPHFHLKFLLFIFVGFGVHERHHLLRLLFSFTYFFKNHFLCWTIYLFVSRRYNSINFLLLCFSILKHSSTQKLHDSYIFGKNHVDVLNFNQIWFLALFTTHCSICHLKLFYSKHKRQF